MKVERVDDCRVKFSISFHELQERGFEEEEIWRNSHIWYDLFDEMLDEAEDSFGIVAAQTISIEVYSLTIQAIELILTLEIDEDDRDLLGDSISEPAMQAETLLVTFDELESLIALCHRLYEQALRLDVEWYTFASKHYFYITLNETTNALKSLILEYGDVSSDTIYMVKEYGKMILGKNPIEQVVTYFH